jgi:hypothetical protein
VRREITRGKKKRKKERKSETKEKKKHGEKKNFLSLLDKTFGCTNTHNRDTTPFDVASLSLELETLRRGEGQGLRLRKKREGTRDQSDF